jgi:Family of unknown function (DUF6516)
VDDSELELLLDLDGAVFEMTGGLVVEVTAKVTKETPERPHGISYALVLRPKAGGAPWVRFDNAHRVKQRSRGYKWSQIAYDHRHSTAKDRGRPYHFSTAIALLDDFWREVKRALDEKGIPNDL